MSVFPPVPSDLSFPELEERILARWAEQGTFQRSIDERPDDSRYTFYDGPPFATGLPHYGHLVASTLKDIVPRYWTMRGHRVDRRFGWDTHGLPIEMLVEKELGLSGPTSVREHGVADFNETCRANVLTYTEEWRKVITRLGRWVDFDRDYKTMDASFMESVWWVFKELWDKDLVYTDFRVMPFSWRLSTSLSNFEANMDYRQVQDPAVTVAMPAADGSGDVFLIWTTTPWTLPSNLAIAVGPELPYVRARKQGDDTVYVVAKDRLKAVLGKKAEVLEELTGADLVGRSYQPLFPYFADRADLPAGEGKAFVVIGSGHVTTGDGTGLVHMAPDFGEDDFAACRAVGIDVLLSVDDEGRFEPSITDFAGRNIKEADPDLIRWIKDAGRLFKHETIDHSYPFCWRSGTPLIYKTVPGWFVKRDRAASERMQAHNDTIHWVPDVDRQHGRFGNWLADARDWNVSPQPLLGHAPAGVALRRLRPGPLAVGSIAELSEGLSRRRPGHRDRPAPAQDRPPDRSDLPELRRHARCSGSTAVFDCWFESRVDAVRAEPLPVREQGRRPSRRTSRREFIAEGLDQTRGWFYTLLVLSTALFDRPAVPELRRQRHGAGRRRRQDE